jgi:2-oxoglutarate ferredoxin oxidoreductase subunit alpha
MKGQKIYTLKIGGQAGQGIKSAGIMFAKFATRLGYSVYNYIEYPSLIRGGHNVMQMNVSAEPVTTARNRTDLLVALDQNTVDFHKDELEKGAGVIYDSDKKFNVEGLPDGVEKYGVPLAKLAKEAGGSELLINTVALGVVAGLWGGKPAVLGDLLEEEFSHKSKEIIDANLKAMHSGFKYALDNFTDTHIDKLKEMKVPETRMVLNGNEAAALGAIAGGVQFACIYPMSPISNILHVLARHQEKYGYVYKQPEDEISALGMALGASFAGARSFTTTSGGGFCLMAEMFGMAGIGELPVVIVEGMRGGPATGLPTWSDQGDLRFVLHVHQGDFPRIVLAPGDVEETFHMTAQAMNLAEKYQLPIVVLIDKNICENDQTIPFLDVSDYKVDRGTLTMDKVEDFKRYEVTASGISMRSAPGTGNFFIANSDEHNEYGYSEESVENRNAQMEKRMRKLETCIKEDMAKPVLYGPEDADVTIVSWGSNKGTILQAMQEFDNVNYLHITWMHPFPSEEVGRVLSKAKYLIDIECNYTAQLAGLIREKTGINIQDKFLKYDGRPFYLEEVTQKLNSVLKGGNL